MLDQNAPGAFTVTYYPGEAALRDAIRNRDVYGGISFGPRGAQPADRHGRQPDGRADADPDRQRHGPAGRHAAADRGPGPAAADDPRGAGLAASALPITLAGLLPAIALVFVLAEVWTRFALPWCSPARRV